jgi:hypothetical protein
VKAPLVCKDFFYTTEQELDSKLSGIWGYDAWVENKIQDPKN